MFLLIVMACVKKILSSANIPPQLQKPVRSKLSVRTVINLKL